MWNLSKFKASKPCHIQNPLWTENVYLLLHLQNKYTNQISTDNKS